MLVRIEKYVRAVEIWMAAAASAITIGLAVMLTVGGVGRAVFNQPLKGDYDIVQMALPWIIFFSFGYALAVQAHVRVTLFLDRLSARARVLVDILVGLAGVAICAVLITGGIQKTGEAFAQHLYAYPGILELPAWIAFLSMPLGLAVFFFEFAIRLLKDILELGKGAGRTALEQALVDTGQTLVPLEGGR